MNLINDFESNKVLGFKNPDKIIETLLSKIFFFGDTVCKIYKWQSAFYGDLSDANFRKQFVAEDFFWNNIMSPDIYKKLLPLKYDNGEWKESLIENADDLCIVMNKLKNEETLTDFIESGRMNSDVARNFVSAIVQKQRDITDFRRKELSALLAKNLDDIERQEIEDLRSWAYMAKDKLPKEKTDYVVSKLLSILDLPEYNDWREKAHKSACIDGNGDNIIIALDKILFIDILPPKFNWRVKDEALNISRIAADISALTGNVSLVGNLYDIYEQFTGLRIPLVVRKLYETRGAMIQAAYRFILNQDSRAEKYLNFAERISQNT